MADGSGLLTSSSSGRLDPKADPARRCLKLKHWPGVDQRAWYAAVTPGGLLDEAGLASHWRPVTRKSVQDAASTIDPTERLEAITSKLGLRQVVQEQARLGADIVGERTHISDRAIVDPRRLGKERRVIAGLSEEHSRVGPLDHDAFGVATPSDLDAIG